MSAPLFSDTPAGRKDAATAQQQQAARNKALDAMLVPGNDTYNAKVRAVIDTSQFCCVPGCTAAAHSMPWDPTYALCGEHTMQAIDYGKRAGLDVDEQFNGAVARRVTRNQQQGTQEGWVYYAATNDRIKIGFTRDVRQRMKSYGPGTTVLAVEPGDRALEAQRHREFADHLADGREWFLDSLPIREHIKDLRDRYGDTRDLNYVYRKHNRDGITLAHTDTKKARHLG